MGNERLITYCGLCCLDCHGYTGRIPDLARDLRAELKRAKYGKFANAISNVPFAKALGDYDRCWDVLGVMAKLRCTKGCRNGGGPPFCKIRKCSKKKGYEGCWECAEFETCEKLDFLVPAHDNAHIKNLRLIAKKGTTAFLSGKRGW
jgi:hypothetical protein